MELLRPEIELTTEWNWIELSWKKKTKNNSNNAIKPSKFTVIGIKSINVPKSSLELKTYVFCENSSLILFCKCKKISKYSNGMCILVAVENF